MIELNHSNGRKRRTEAHSDSDSSHTTGNGGRHTHVQNTSMQILTHPTQQETEKGTCAERFKGPGTLGMTCPFPPLWPRALPVHLPVQLVSVVSSPENQPGVGGGSWQDFHKKRHWWVTPADLAATPPRVLGDQEAPP